LNIHKSKKLEEIEIVDPKGTKWCHIEVAKVIAKWIEPESEPKSEKGLSNMLPQSPEKILEQMEKGLTLLAIFREKVVGHVTLWEYNVDGFGELGSLIVDPQFRGRGIGTALCKALSQRFPSIFLIATVKTKRAKHVLEKVGFKVVPFDQLKKISESAWRECCICIFPPEKCPLRDKPLNSQNPQKLTGCLLLIRKPHLK